MPKIADVVRQLQTVLPKYSENFCAHREIASVTSLGGGLYQVTTTEKHGLKVADFVRLYGIGVQNPITARALSGGKITFTTQFDHDLTEWRQEGVIPNVSLTSVPGITDGEYPLVSVPLKNKFVITSGAAGGVAGRLNEIRIDGLNGNFTVAEIVSTTAFKISAPDCQFTAFNIFETSYLTTAPRISGLAAAERIAKMYSEQTKTTDFWAFVVNEDSRVSHDREVESDAVQRKERVDMILFEGNQPFTVYVVCPATDSYGGRLLSDEMIAIRAALCRSLVGADFDTGFSEETRFVTTFLGDGFFAYVGAYYVHRFTFETVFMFNPEDAIDPADTRAFRRFEIGAKMPFDDYEVVKKTIEGDLP